MPKLKTHKGTKKVCNVRPGGTIKIGKPGTRHNTGKKTTAEIRTVATIIKIVSIITFTSFLLNFQCTTKLFQ